MYILWIFPEQNCCMLQSICQLNWVEKKLTNPTEKAVFSDEETLKEVVDCLKENISIKTQSDCQQTDLFNILVGAASKADTVENTASTLKNSWSGRNVRVSARINKAVLFSTILIINCNSA